MGVSVGVGVGVGVHVHVLMTTHTCKNIYYNSSVLCIIIIIMCIYVYRVMPVCELGFTG